MKNLFEILGAHPDDDAEKLKNAFRKAVKANHPDLRMGDPNASMRIRRIIDAYAILRDEKKRRAYERRLSLKCRQLRAKPKIASSYTMFNAMFDAVIVAGMASVLIAGYIAFERFPAAPMNLIKAIDESGYQTALAATIQSASQTGAADRVEPGDMPVGAILNVAPAADGIAPQANGNLPVTISGQQVSGLLGQEPGVARPLNASGASVEQSGTGISGTPAKKEFGMKPPDRSNVNSFGGQLSSPARNGGAPKLPLTGLAMSSDKHDAGIFGKPRAAMSPRSPLLENRSTSGCFGSIFFTGRIRPLFGAAFYSGSHSY